VAHIFALLFSRCAVQYEGCDRFAGETMRPNRGLLLCGLAGLVMVASAWQAPGNTTAKPAGNPQRSSAPAAAPATASPAATPQKPQLKPVLAEDVYKNIEVFKGKPATRLLPAMLALRELLGVECSYCHTPLDWENEDKKTKQKARQHFDMIGYLNHDHFADKNKVSCWTCHRGESVPARYVADDEMVKRMAQMIAIPAGEGDKPAEQVFKNIQTLKGVPASRFPFIMTFFSQSLGVRCGHCHVPNQWEKDDKPQKETARKMLAMVTATIHKYYGNTGPIGCFTCHHGSPQPELTGKDDPATPAAAAPQPKPQL
jgi:hypothetical protein